jgi:uncharacterized protein
MTDADRKHFAETFIASLRAQDASLLRTICSETALWSLPGTSLVSGEAMGIDGIMKRAHGLATRRVNLEILHVLYGFEGFAIMLNNTGTFEGKVLNEYLTTVAQVRDNKIHRLDTYISDVEMLNEYFK